MSSSGPRRLIVEPLVPIRTRSFKRKNINDSGDSVSEIDSKSLPSDAKKPAKEVTQKPPQAKVAERISVQRSPFVMKLAKDDGEPVFDDEGFLNNQQACRALSRAISTSPRDISVLQRMADNDLAGLHAQVITTANLTGDALYSRLSKAVEDKKELEKEYQSLQTDYVAAHLEVSRLERVCGEKESSIRDLQLSLAEEKRIKEDEFRSNTKQLKASMGQFFRMGFVQRGLASDDRIYVSPDEFDACFGIDAGSYDFLPGMNPDDRPATPDSDQGERHVGSGEINPVAPATDIVSVDIPQENILPVSPSRTGVETSCVIAKIPPVKSKEATPHEISKNSAALEPAKYNSLEDPKH